MIQIRLVPLQTACGQKTPESYIIYIADGEEGHFQSGPLGVVVKQVTSLDSQL